MFNYSSDILSNKEHLAKIAKRLHDERTHANLSLEKLAEKLNYTKPTVHSWERGWESASGENRLPAIDQLYALAKLYECTPGYLLCEYEGRTKELTDVAAVTGLTECNIKLLDSYFHEYKINPYYNYGIDMYLAFVNYFLEHSMQFHPLFIKRRQLETLKMELKYDKYREIILSSHPVIQPALSKVPRSSALYKVLCEKILEKFYSDNGFKGYDLEMLVSNHSKYLDILFPDDMKQSDFLISDTFLDLVKEFFSNLNSNVDTYTDQCKYYLDPALFEPIPIVTGTADNED